MATIREFVADVLMDKLDEYEGTSAYGADLAYDLLQEYNVDGSYTYNTYEARQWVQEHFIELDEIVEAMEDESLPPVNVFDNPEAFQVQIMIYVACELLGQCDTVDEVWDEEFTLEANVIKKIKKELDEIV